MNRIHTTINALCHNGMIYKEITQWLRQRSFGGVFIGLLALCELVALIFGTIELGENENAGMIMFGLLTGLLVLYGVVLAFSSHMMTAREFRDQTFELYALAGMSLEKMVLGKLLSFMTSFFFGACCIVPFQFFAYLLGGVDFYTILGTLALAFLVAPLFYLSVLLLAAYQKHKIMRVVSQIIIVLSFLFFGPWMLFAFFAISFSGGGPDFSITNFVNALLEPAGWAWGGLAVGLLFYTQLCLLLFYLTAHAMRPATDSREHVVKGYATSLMTCLVVLIAWEMLRTPATVSGVANTFFKPMMVISYLLMCAMGLACFYGPLPVPVIIRRQQEDLVWRRSPRHWLKRFLFFWFEPGPRGLLRTLLLLIILLGAFGLIAYHFMSPGSPGSGMRGMFGGLFRSAVGVLTPSSKEVLQYLSYPISVPFFLAFPAIFLYLIPKLARSRMLAGMVLVYWLVSGLTFSILTSIMMANRRALESLSEYQIMWLSVFLSPMSSISTEAWARQLNLELDFYFLRFGMGALGVLLMVRILQHRARLDAPAAKPPITGAAVPPRIPQAALQPSETTTSPSTNHAQEPTNESI